MVLRPDNLDTFLKNILKNCYFPLDSPECITALDKVLYKEQARGRERKEGATIAAVPTGSIILTKRLSNASQGAESVSRWEPVLGVWGVSSPAGFLF